MCFSVKEKSIDVDFSFREMILIKTTIIIIWTRKLGLSDYCDIVVYEFESHLVYYVHFWTNFVEKCMTLPAVFPKAIG